MDGGRNDKMPASNVEVYMNMAKKLVLATGLTLLGGAAANLMLATCHQMRYMPDKVVAAQEAGKSIARQGECR